MRNYLVKNNDNQVFKMLSKVDPSTLQLPDGFVVLGLEEDFEVPESSALKFENDEIIVDQTSIRNSKLSRIRERRSPLLVEADYLINIATDNNGSNLQDLRDYRQDLRDCTSSIVANMSTVDAIDPETFVFPSKP